MARSKDISYKKSCISIKPCYATQELGFDRFMRRQYVSSGLIGGIIMRLSSACMAVTGIVLCLCANASATVCEPDNFAPGTVLTNACDGLTLLVEQRSDTVVVEIPFVSTATSTGTQVFGHSTDDFGWGSGDANPETMRGNFSQPANSVSIDLISNDASDSGFLRVYDSSDVLLAEVLSGSLTINQVFTAMVSRPTSDIAYFRASGLGPDNLNLDNLNYVLEEPTISVLLDIKPGGDPNEANPINLKSKGVLPVAILGSDTFDVTTIDVDSLLFGDPNAGATVSPLRFSYEEVSGDAFLDLSLKFSVPELVDQGAIGASTIEGLLKGVLLDNTPIEGLDSIRIVPPNGSNGNTPSIVANVPEPASFTLALFSLCLVRKRRR